MLNNQLETKSNVEKWELPKPEYPERTTDHGQATGKLFHLWLRVEFSLKGKKHIF
jgi:hypothetical protein